MSGPLLRAKRTIYHALRRIGLEVRRTRAAEPAGFYQVSPTCQIPELSFLYELFFSRTDTGLFVEVGAYDGYTFSNTSCLVEAGWSGHYIEPVPAAYTACRDRYAANSRVQVHNLAIGAEEQTIEMHLGGPLSTASGATVEEYKQVSWTKSSFRDNSLARVAQQPLDLFLERENVHADFDLLVVDVEGYEVQVFEGFDLARWHPKMMIVELADTHPDFASHRAEHARLSSEIQSSYSIVYKDAANTVFVVDDLVECVYDNAPSRSRSGPGA